MEKILKRLELAEFKLDLLYENTETSRELYRINATREQRDQLLNLMNDYRKKIAQKEKVSHGLFEEEVYKICPQIEDNFGFCESLTRNYMEEGRWKEVFSALYGDMDKYKSLDLQQEV